MAKFNLKDLEQFEQFVGESKAKLELTNSSGDVAIMELEPIEAKHIGKIVYLQNNMPSPRVLNPVEVKAGRPARYESDEEFLKRMKDSDYDVYGKLFELLILWVKQSYPDIPEPMLNKLIMNNVKVFMDTFMEQHNDVDESSGKGKEIKDFIKQKQNAQNEETQ